MKQFTWPQDRLEHDRERDEFYANQLAAENKRKYERARDRNKAIRLWIGLILFLGYLGMTLGMIYTGHQFSGNEAIITSFILLLLVRALDKQNK